MKKIVPLGREAGYLEGRKMTAARGMKLPSHVLHDDYLVRTNRWKELEEIYPPRVREILVHPARNGKFAKGKDVVDCKTGWCLPANYLADPRYVNADVFRKGTGLFVDPEDVRKEGGRIVVIPALISVLYPFIQKNGTCGKVDEATRVPLAVKPQTGEKERWLYRIKGVAVRPLFRSCFPFAWLNVYATVSPDEPLGVAGEASDAGASQKKK